MDTSSTTNNRVLCVDDEPELREIIGFYLEELGYRVEFAGDGKQALDMAINNDYAFVMTDLDMPRMNGVEFIKQIRLIKPYLPIGITSAKITVFAQELVSLAVSATVPKPFTNLHIQNAAKELAHTASLFEQAKSPEKLNRVENVMRTNLVTGKPSESILDVTERMVSRDVGSILICEEKALKGILTERDLMRMIAEKVSLDQTVDQYMNKTPDTISPCASIQAAEQVISSKKCRYLPVVAKGAAVGILSAGDLGMTYLSSIKNAVEKQIIHLNNIIPKK
ncbi:MAG: response regulator [Oligoflexales bacterium]|nr:response regulator [Oligoflexales bacterium]